MTVLRNVYHLLGIYNQTDFWLYQYPPNISSTINSTWNLLLILKRSRSVLSSLHSVAFVVCVSVPLRTTKIFTLVLKSHQHYGYISTYISQEWRTVKFNLLLKYSSFWVFGHNLFLSPLTNHLTQFHLNHKIRISRVMSGNCSCLISKRLKRD